MCFSFIPYKNTLPIIGGISKESSYYKDVKREIGFVNDCVGIEFMRNTQTNGSNGTAGDSEWYSPQDFYDKYDLNSGEPISDGGINVTNMNQYGCNFNFSDTSIYQESVQKVSAIRAVCENGETPLIAICDSAASYVEGEEFTITCGSPDYPGDFFVASATASIDKNYYYSRY